MAFVAAEVAAVEIEVQVVVLMIECLNWWKTTANSSPDGLPHRLS